MTSTASIVLRHATAADEPALADLAGLDSQRKPPGPFLIAEVEGRPWAALSLSDGAVIADPFRRTAGLVELLQAHAAAAPAGARGARGLSRRRRPRLAFGL